MVAYSLVFVCRYLSQWDEGNCIGISIPLLRDGGCILKLALDGRPLDKHTMHIHTHTHTHTAHATKIRKHCSLEEIAVSQQILVDSVHIIWLCTSTTSLQARAIQISVMHIYWGCGCWLFRHAIFVLHRTFNCMIYLSIAHLSEVASPISEREGKLGHQKCHKNSTNHANHSITIIIALCLNFVDTKIVDNNRT